MRLDTLEGKAVGTCYHWRFPSTNTRLWKCRGYNELFIRIEQQGLLVYRSGNIIFVHLAFTN